MFLDFLDKIKFINYKNILFKERNYVQRVEYLHRLKKIVSKSNFIKNEHKCKSCNFFAKILTNKKKFYKFYKKFNTHLKLRSTYDSKLVSISNKETCLKSYLIFSKELLKFKKLNSIQKLNTILKINDIIILAMFSKGHLRSNYDKTIFDQIKINIKYEKQLLKKFLI